LAITFFLLAFRPVDVPHENEQMGFSDLLALMIIPKVLWISTAMSAFGIGFSFFATNEGYKNMLLIGGASIAFATLLLGIFTITGVKHIRVVAPIKIAVSYGVSIQSFLRTGKPSLDCLGQFRRARPWKTLIDVKNAVPGTFGFQRRCSPVPTR